MVAPALAHVALIKPEPPRRLSSPKRRHGVPLVQRVNWKRL